MKSVLDLAWSAGILEGEGSFIFRKASTIEVSVSQKDPEILYRLGSLFGGRVRVRNVTTHGAMHEWRLFGTVAAGVCMSLYGFFSKRRREQIRTALGEWKRRAASTKNRTMCKRGHPLVQALRQRVCPICRREGDALRRRWKRRIDPDEVPCRI